MQNPFDQKKKCIEDEIYSNINQNSTDLSPKGTIDTKCIPIIKLINSNKNMVTTSTCSGRVSVFVEGFKSGISSQNDVQIGSKGNSGHWIFVTHEPQELPGWYKKQDFDYAFEDGKEIPARNDTRYILYKFEPLILHVKCRDTSTASELYKVAMGCGFRESGIGVNNIVAIRISIKLDIPIGYVDASEGKNQKLVCFVKRNYLELIDQLSLDRFKENFKKLDNLYAAIEKMNFSSEAAGVSTKAETKEERRERKKREGLERQKNLLKGKQTSSHERQSNLEVSNIES